MSKHKINSKNTKSIPIHQYEYEMIDGNWTIRPYAYCHYYHGYLTKNMALCHNCEKRNCNRFMTFEQYEEWKLRPENLPDYPITL